MNMLIQREISSLFLGLALYEWCKYTHTYIYRYIFIYMYIAYIFTYVYMYIYSCVYMYLYLYTYLKFYFQIVNGNKIFISHRMDLIKGK